MIRDFLNWILNHLHTRPSDEELIAYGRQLEREEVAQGFAKVEIIAPPPAAYEPPSPTTDGMRHRAVTRKLQDNPGLLFNHDRKMREQKNQPSDEPQTKILSRIPQPKRLEFHRMIGAEDSDFDAR